MGEAVRIASGAGVGYAGQRRRREQQLRLIEWRGATPTQVHCRHTARTVMRSPGSKRTPCDASLRVCPITATHHLACLRGFVCVHMSKLSNRWGCLPTDPWLQQPAPWRPDSVTTARSSCCTTSRRRLKRQCHIMPHVSIGVWTRYGPSSQASPEVRQWSRCSASNTSEGLGP
jgi:hypothetical protein